MKIIPERYLAELQDLLTDVRDLAAARPKTVLRWLLAISVASWLLATLDDQIGSWIANPEAPGRLALAAGFWGGFWPLAVPISVVTWSLGYARRRRSLRLAALGCLLAAAAAGLAAGLVAHVTGRPRPASTAPDGFCGPHAADAYHSFPARATATVTAGATALATALPALRIPCYAAAAAVGWADVRRQRHHLSDTLFGAALGFGLGLLAGTAARSAAGRAVRWTSPQAATGLGPLLRDWHRLFRSRRISETHVRVRAPRPGDDARGDR